MYADLHLHSIYSDGTYTPAEVAANAKREGIGLIALCDHNTTDAFSELAAACAEQGIRCITGVEIDCESDGKWIHVLGYGIDRENSALKSVLNENLDIMEQQSVDMIECMAADYPQISLAEYQAYERDPRHGGWKGVDYLRSKGLTDGFPDCMRFYEEYAVGFSKPFPDAATLCRLIHDAGGKAVLAHPCDRLDIGSEDFIPTLEKLVEYGIDGLECFYPSQDAYATGVCLDFCKEHNLMITAGSDDHGDFAKYIHGVYYAIGEVMVDTERLELRDLL